MSYWWMSFTDQYKPEGTQFLGALIIEADDECGALVKSHLLELNPGSEVLAVKVPEQLKNRILDEWIDRKLISREECEIFDAHWVD